MNNPKISIIIPVYNTEKYIAKCLDSVLAQTFKDFEVICIDDGSTDNSLEILKEYAQKDDRVIIFSQTNKGVSVARNLGIEKSRGEFIQFVDADDWIKKDCVELAYTKIKENNTDIVTFAYNDIVKGEVLPSNYILEPLKYYENREIDLSDFMPFTNVIWNKLFRKEFLLKNNIKFPINIKTCEDGIFNLLCLFSKAKYSCLPKILYNYVKIRKNSAMDKSIQLIKSDLLAIFVFINMDIFKTATTELKIFAINKFLNSLLYVFEDKRNKLCKFIYIFQLQQGLKKLSSKIDKKLLECTIFYSIQKEYNLIKWYIKHIFSITNKKSKNDKICKVITILGIKFSFKINLKNEEFPTSLVVSLTSFPARINFVHEAIETLLNQSLKADKVILWLGEEEFENKEESLPKALLNLREKGLEIKWCKDIKSYKKLIPTLKEYPNSIIVTADDDILYPENWLKDLYANYLKNPNEIQCHRAHRVSFDKNGNILPYTNWITNIFNVKSSYNNFLTGSGGALYPPNILHKDVLNKELFMKLCPTADDIWFWAMAVLNNKKINVIHKQKKFELKYVKGSQDNNCLKMINVGKNRNDIQLKKVFEYYPQILEKLEKKNIKNPQKVHNLSFIEKIFSIKNQLHGDTKHKVITILGIKIKFNKR